MRIIFMGTPDFAVPTLQALVDAAHDVVCVYTQPPRPGGRRGRELTPSPVQSRAEDLGIEVRHPTSLKSAEEQAHFAELDADVAVVAAYGLILPQAVLDAPEHGCLNVHASIPLIDLAALHPLEQDDDKATYAAKIDKSEARIHWSRPAEEVVRQIHGLSPFPGAWFELDGDRVKVLRAEKVDGEGSPGEVLDAQLTIACGEGALRPLELQRAGKPKMDLETFLRGNKVAAGTIFD